jgi:hypothetical protein
MTAGIGASAGTVGNAPGPNCAVARDAGVPGAGGRTGGRRSGSAYPVDPSDAVARDALDDLGPEAAR